MVYLTRFQLKKILLKSKKKLHELLPILYLEAISVYHNKYKFKINYNHINDILKSKNIEFFSIENGHWAETDCKKIWLNINKFSNSNFNDLLFTIVHEAIHGLILYEINGNFLNEWREHQIMGNSLIELI